jgi:DNA-binding response OmpR family regulator
VNDATVLLVEDDLAIKSLVAFHLKRSGFRVVEARTVEEAWQRLDQADVLVLDWMLPDDSGISFLRRLRTQDRAAMLPVLMLTARAGEVDRVEGLEAGADDYLVKPFSTAELVARLRALLRRVDPAHKYLVGDLTIDVAKGSVRFGGNYIDLTRREFELLSYLAAHPGRIFSRGELLDRVWGEDFFGTERTVDQHVAQLRARFRVDLIETVRGRGYRLVSGE